MSEPKLISPLLDGFIMGAPISSHHGVRCCPAMKQNSDGKYIVKIISVPASQTQLDALLLTGAYKDPGDAMDYFKEISDGIVEEADFLLKVSKLEGFLSYEGYQVVPMGDNRLGYLVYLLGSYKRSLDKYIRRNPVTHLDSVKMGLDLCSALSACRRAGSIYVALKPTNVFVSEDKEFRIGDLGFVPLDSLKYASLPGKYRSAYSPPEVLDPLQTLNETVDTYALGMILYQVYNGGKLPTAGENGTAPFPVPVYADSEIARIIMKAIDPVPENRWKDPVAMGQALVAYLQSNEVLDTPISAATPAAAPVGTDTQVFSTQAVSAAIAAQGISSDTRVLPSDQLKNLTADPVSIGSVSSDTKVLPTAAVSSDTRTVPTAQVRSVVSMDTRGVSAVNSAAGAAVATPKQIEYSEEDYDELYDQDYDEDDEEDEENIVRVIPETPRRRRKPIGKGFIAMIIVLVLLAGIAYGGYYYYSNYYLQTINSMTIQGMHDHLTVLVDTQVDESLLTVSCTDTYGNAMEQKLVNGRAEFGDLRPNSQYKIVLEIEGFHQLVGKTSDVFNTESRTEIVSFTGITGSEDGSVLLTFTVDGPEPEKWIMTYSAEGEEEMSQEFTGHSVTIKDLAYPKIYTFEISPSEQMYMTGQTTLEFASSPLVMAQNLTITACNGSELTVRWDTPENEEVESWAVRCYSDSGYEQTLDTSENQAVFTGIDSNSVYYVEVTASGMTQPARTSITANPITITSLKVNEEDPYKLIVSWDFLGQEPDGGWLLMYSMDGSNTQSVVKCDSASAEISPRIHGAEYRFVIQAADSTSIFSNIHTYSCPNAEVYKDHSFDASRTYAYLIVTPEKENWTSGDISKDDYTDTFSVGQEISIVLFCDNRFYIPEDEISILYVIRNGEGQVVSKLISQATDDWHDMWVHHNVNYAELDLPTAPTEIGSYNLSIYFNGKSIASTDFSIVE